LARVAVSPEEIGLCGCWQVLAVRRQRTPLGSDPDPPTDVIGYYATSLSHGQYSDQELLKIVSDHWAAIENGSHYRRDNTFGEDSCQVSQHGAVEVLSALRNLAIGLYELAREQGRTQTSEFKSWCRQMTGSSALKLVRRG
jgi:hypothetical protein